jgi:hypothetical protein
MANQVASRCPHPRPGARGYCCGRQHALACALAGAPATVAAVAGRDPGARPARARAHAAAAAATEFPKGRDLEHVRESRED